MTNEKTKQCGIYEISKRQISYDTGYTIDTVSILLQYFISEKKIWFSEATNEIAVRNWAKYNGSRSPQVQTLINQELKQVKDKTLIQYRYSIDTVPILNAQEEEEEEQEKEKEPEVEEVGSEKARSVSNEVWKDQAWKESICMGLGLNFDQLQKWMALFNASVANDKIYKFDKSSYKKMVRGWIQKQQSKGTVIETGIQKAGTAPPLKKI